MNMKKLPIAKKRARAENQAGRFAGLSLVGELEQSKRGPSRLRTRSSKCPDHNRGAGRVAFDRCGLMSWSVHEKWVSTMLNQLSKKTPHGYGHIKVEQLIRADRELFTILSQENIGSLKPDAGITFGCCVRALIDITWHYDNNMTLMCWSTLFFHIRAHLFSFYAPLSNRWLRSSLSLASLALLTGAGLA